MSTFAGMMAISPFVSQYHVRFPRPRESRMQRLVELIESGQLTPVIDSVFPLDQAREALDRLTTGSVAGKIVIAVAPEG
jgi:NADPH:quinone reductase-like Zn-dependent oxidoreductase